MDTRLLKEQALAHLGEYEVNTNILCVVAKGVNEDEVGQVLELGMKLPFVRGVTFHTMVYTGKGGKHFPRDSRVVITTPDIMRLLSEQTAGRLTLSDFTPIPAPHPLCETNTYMLMPEEGPPIPLPRIIPKEKYFDLVVNQAILRPDDRLEERLKEIIDHLYACANPTDEQTRALVTFKRLLKSCFPADGHLTAAERERICERAIKSVFIIPYMDEHNLDLTRLRSCVSMQATPDGRLIPNCAYYPLHRLNDERFFPKGKLPMFTAAMTKGSGCGS